MENSGKKKLMIFLNQFFEWINKIDKLLFMLFKNGRERESKDMGQQFQRLIKFV